MQVTNVPVFRAVMRSHTRRDLPNDRTMAVSSNLPRSPRETQRRVLEVLRWHHSDAVYVEHSMSNVRSVTKPNSLLVPTQNRGRLWYSPCTNPRAPDHHRRPGNDSEGLRERYSLRNEGGRRTRHSPAWCESVLIPESLMLAGRVTKVTCHRQ